MDRTNKFAVAEPVQRVTTPPELLEFVRIAEQSLERITCGIEINTEAQLTESGAQRYSNVTATSAESVLLAADYKLTTLNLTKISRS